MVMKTAPLFQPQWPVVMAAGTPSHQHFSNQLLRCRMKIRKMEAPPFWVRGLKASFKNSDSLAKTTICYSTTSCSIVWCNFGHPYIISLLCPYTRSHSHQGEPGNFQSQQIFQPMWDRLRCRGWKHFFLIAAFHWNSSTTHPQVKKL